jgi:hypothetical protein
MIFVDVPSGLQWGGASVKQVLGAGSGRNVMSLFMMVVYFLSTTGRCSWYVLAY